MRLVNCLMMGFEILDTRTSFAALVFCADGRAASAVCNLVLRADAVGRTLIGLDTICRLALLLVAPSELVPAPSELALALLERRCWPWTLLFAC